MVAILIAGIPAGDECRDGGRLEGSVRDSAGRYDDQAAVPPEQAGRPRPSHDNRPDCESRPDLLVATPLAILVAGNLGYMAAHFFAITGFLLLRKDRPNWPRPIKLPSVWIPIAVILAALNALFIVVGATSAGLSGYGGKKELWIGVGVLLISVVLYIYRRVVQDKGRVSLREEAPSMPPGESEPASVVARGSAR